MTPNQTRESVPTPGVVTQPSAGSPRRVRLFVHGMTCGACAAKIEHSLNQLPHVRASVNYASEHAEVELEEEVPLQLLLRQVDRAGYSAEPLPARPSPGAQAAEDSRRVRYLGRRLLVAALLFMPLPELSMALSLIPWLRFPGWQFLLIALSAPVVLWAAWPFHRAALRAARHRAFTMDTLVSMGITAATGWSVYAMFFRDFSEPGRSGLYVLLHQGGGDLYVEVAAGLTTFLLAGRYFEAICRRRAGNALRSLAELSPGEVSVLGPDGSEILIPAEQLRVGDRFVVRPGQTVASDGAVVLGQGELDSSAMTGEAAASEVGEGSELLGGTVLLNGRVIVRATRVGADTQLAQMMDLVEQAQLQKARVQRLADRIAAIFVPCVVAAALLAFAGWMLAGRPLEFAFGAGLTVLIISCPCALGLATPAALRVASGRGAQLGIFFKGYQGLETAREVDTVVLDKTGTVTEGRMELAGFRAAPGENEELALRQAGALEQASEHVLAAAVAAAARERFGNLPQPERFVNLPGLGARGWLEGHELLVGRPKLLAQEGISVPPELARQATKWEVQRHTAALLARDGVAVAALAVSDRVKPSARAAVARLQTLGLDCVLLTGDNEATARAVAAEVGISTVVAGALPHEKVALVRQLQAQGHRVAMVGDGINDGPALVSSDLGLALGSGTDVAINAAHLILLRDDLQVVPDAICLARRTSRTIWHNLLWAFGYNVVAIPVAALGLLDPLLAGAAMALSSGFVVWNSSRIRNFQGWVMPLSRPPSPAASRELRSPAPAGAAE